MHGTDEVLGRFRHQAQQLRRRRCTKGRWCSCSWNFSFVWLVELVTENKDTRSPRAAFCLGRPAGAATWRPHAPDTSRDTPEQRCAGILLDCWCRVAIPATAIDAGLAPPRPRNQERRGRRDDPGHPEQQRQQRSTSENKVVIQRYLRRICPQIVEEIDQACTDRPGATAGAVGDLFDATADLHLVDFASAAIRVRTGRPRQRPPRRGARRPP